MGEMAGAFLAIMIMISVIFRIEAMLRMGEELNAEWKRRWDSLTEGKRREEAGADFEGSKTMSAAGLNAANLVGIIGVSFVVFVVGDLTATSDVLAPEVETAFRWIRVIFAALVLFLGIMPWLAIYYNDTARRAKHYGVFNMGRRGRFLDLGFAAVALSSLLLAIPALREWFLLIPYFALAGVSLYIFNAWLFFNRPPREAT